MLPVSAVFNKSVEFVTSKYAQTLLLGVCLILLIVLVARKENFDPTNVGQLNHQSTNSQSGVGKEGFDLNSAGHLRHRTVRENFRTSDLPQAAGWEGDEELYRSQNDWAQEAGGHPENVGRDVAGWVQNNSSTKTAANPSTINDEALAEALHNK